MSILDRYLGTLQAKKAHRAEHLRAYFDWQAARHGREFLPTEDDDADIRTFILALRSNGANRVELRRATSALKHFYAWLVDEAFLSESPFDQYHLDRPLLTRQEIRRRRETLTGTPEQREIARLRALNRLAAQLNRAVDSETALDTALQIIVEIMGLKTAWLYRLDPEQFDPETQHDFRLAAACELPPGLEQDDRHFLRRAPDCHCQYLLRGGRIARAVNVVECSRLDSAAGAHGDNRGLLYHASVPLMVDEQLFGILNVATDEWQFFTSADLQFLTALGALVTAALERAELYDLTKRQNLYLQNELEMAREVQASLIPQDLPNIPGFEFAAAWRSAREVSGDFYDLFPLVDGRWAFVIADVADKGAPAALYMAMTRSLLRSFIERDSSPGRALELVNQTLSAHSGRFFFVTLFCGILDPATQAVVFANAGHHPALLRRSSGAVEQLARTGYPLGIVPDAVYSERRVSLHMGDALLAYTDGVTDAQSPGSEEFGADRLCDTFLRAPAGAKEQIAAILHDLDQFAQDTPPQDDITLLAVCAL